jgi:hypothetical protein
MVGDLFLQVDLLPVVVLEEDIEVAIELTLDWRLSYLVHPFLEMADSQCWEEELNVAWLVLLEVVGLFMDRLEVPIPIRLFLVLVSKQELMSLNLAEII